MPIFVTPCILPSHTGFKNIFTSGGVFTENSGKMVDENSEVVVLEEDSNSTVGRAKDPSWSLGRAQGIVYILGQKALSNFLAVVELIPSGLGIN